MECLKNIKTALFLFSILTYVNAKGQLSGNHTIDPSKSASSTNFKTFSAAADSLSLKGVSGPVAFNVANGIYNESVDINFISGASYINTITFQSESKDSSKVILTYPAVTAQWSGVLNLLNCSYVTIKQISITDSLGSLIFIGTTGNTSQYYPAFDKILNCRLIGGKKDTIYNMVAIDDGSASNIYIENNYIKYGNDGIEGFFPGTIISHNYIDSCYSVGINLNQTTEFCTITFNTIVNFQGMGYGIWGINFPYCNNIYEISHNKIIMPNGGLGIYGVNSSNDQTSPCRIYDNMISVLNNTDSNYNIGIDLENCDYFDISFNSIYAGGINFYGGNGSESVSLSGSHFNFFNNVVQNPTGDLYIYIYSNSGNNIDYNAYGSVDPYSSWWNNGLLFQDWKDLGYDKHGILLNPKFVSNIDLHSKNITLEGKGVKIPGITTDIDGYIRPNPPSIGANEIISKPDTLHGIITTSKGAALKNQWVYELVYNAGDSIVSAVGSVKTDTNGHYELYTDDTAIYLVAIPDSTIYSDEMQTYFDSSLTFQSATLIHPRLGTSIINFNTIAGGEINGGSSISGKITTCNFKRPAKGQPVISLRVILVNNFNKPLTQTYTDKNGNFGFDKLAAGIYKIWVDYPLIDNSLTPIIKLAADTTIVVNFLLCSTDLQLDTTTASIEQIANTESNLSIYPNPFTAILSISYILFQNQNVQLSVFDITGKQVAQLCNENQSAGKHEINLDAERYNCKAGIYIMKVVINGEAITSKIIKIN